MWHWIISSKYYPSSVFIPRVSIINIFLQMQALDIYLPLLEDASSQASGSVAQLLGAAARSEPYRQAVADWMPPPERNKEVKGKRGWEKTEVLYVSCWVVRHLVTLLHKKDIKVSILVAYTRLLYLFTLIGDSFRKLLSMRWLQWQKTISQLLQR